MRQTSPPAKHFALRIPAELWQVLQAKATHEKRSINAQILIALEHDLAPELSPVAHSRARQAAQAGTST